LRPNLSTWTWTLTSILSRHRFLFWTYTELKLFRPNVCIRTMLIYLNALIFFITILHSFRTRTTLSIQLSIRLLLVTFRTFPQPVVKNLETVTILTLLLLHIPKLWRLTLNAPDSSIKRKTWCTLTLFFLLIVYVGIWTFVLFFLDTLSIVRVKLVPLSTVYYLFRFIQLCSTCWPDWIEVEVIRAFLTFPSILIEYLRAWYTHLSIEIWFG